MKVLKNCLCISIFIGVSNFLLAQTSSLIIGRTTGEISLKNNYKIRVFGFSNSLSGSIHLPGTTINATEGDSIAIDFWNISQGNPHRLAIKGIPLLQKNKENKTPSKSTPIYHMGHGYYSLIAHSPGTYLYYSADNYPFHLQAGMFGCIIVSPRKASFYKEVLWCSHEIDTNWHSNSLMDLEYKNKYHKFPLPKYHPKIFLINGKPTATIKGLIPNALKNTSPILLRLINAGLYIHEIQFPKTIQPVYQSGNIKLLSINSKGHVVYLETGDSIDLLISTKQITKKAALTYSYIEPRTYKIKHKEKIHINY